MLREQRLMKEIADKLGDELNEYIYYFHKCDLWKYKENELVVNKTFKEIAEIITSYNLTTTKELFEKTYDLRFHENDKAILLNIMEYMAKDYLQSGSDCLLNRIMLFCYLLTVFSVVNNKKPTDLIYEICDSNLITTKKSLKAKILYKLNKSKFPFMIEFDNEAIALIAILSGKKLSDTVEYVIDMSNINLIS